MLKKVNHDKIIKEIKKQEEKAKKEAKKLDFFKNELKEKIQKTLVETIKGNKQVFEKGYNQRVGNITNLNGNFQIEIEIPTKKFDKKIRAIEIISPISKTETFKEINISKPLDNKNYQIEFIYGINCFPTKILIKKSEIFSDKVVKEIKNIFKEADCNLKAIDIYNSEFALDKVTYCLMFDYDFRELNFTGRLFKKIMESITNK